MGGDRVAVEGHAGWDDHAREADEVDPQRIADVGAERHRLVPSLFARVPGGDARAAGDERLDGREARARQSQHRIAARSEEHTSELQSLMRISYAVFCLKQKTQKETKCTYTIKQHKDIQRHAKKRTE